MTKNKYHYIIKWFHPFEVVLRRNYGEYYGSSYGLDLDLRSTLTFHSYEYGRILTLRLLGFGFEFSMLEI
jgi:hypothetical protein